MTRSFDVFFDLRLNKPVSEQSWGWWFDTPLCSSWRHCNVTHWGRDKTAAIVQNILLDLMSWKESHFYLVTYICP